MTDQLWGQFDYIVVGAAIRVPALGKALSPPEIGQDIAIGPSIGALALPAVEVQGVAADINEAVDRGGSAQRLAARTGDPAPVQMRLRFAEIAPVEFFLV